MLNAIFSIVKQLYASESHEECLKSDAIESNRLSYFAIINKQREQQASES